MRRIPAYFFHCLVVQAALLGLVTVASAQGPSLTMSADRSIVTVGERFRITIRLDVEDGQSGDIVPPDLGPGLMVVQRGVSGSSMFHIEINGQPIRMPTATVYELIVQAMTPGRYTIPPASTLIGGRQYESRELTIEVADESGLVPDGKPPADESDLGSDAPAEPEDELVVGDFNADGFARLVADRREAYVGEQVQLTVELVVRAPLERASLSAMGATNGLWSYDPFGNLPPHQRPQPQRRPEVIQGLSFVVYPLHHFVVYPLGAGTASIGEWELEAVLVEHFRRLRRTFVVPELRIPVRPLPDPTPAQAVVGNHEIEAAIDPVQIATGNAATVRVTVRGPGNVRDIDLEFPNISGLRALPPQTQDHMEVDPRSYRVTATRTFEWLVVAEQPGNYEIPPFEIHNLDPDTAQYELRGTEPLRLAAAGSAEIPPTVHPETPSVIDAAGPEDELGFGPIRSESELETWSLPIWRTRGCAVALALPAVSLMFLLAVSGYRRRRQNLGGTAHRERQVKEARKQLREARGLASSGDSHQFYAEIESAFRRVLEARLDAPIGRLTHRELEQELVERGMEHAMSKQVVEELEGCQLARFSAAGGSPAEMSAVADRTTRLIEELAQFRPVPRSEEES